MTTRRYAENTEVTPSRSREEIEHLLIRYGATQFAYGWNEQSATLGFKMRNRFVRFRITMPDPQSDEFLITPRGYARTEQGSRDAYQQAVRQRWRALTLVIKAQLEGVEAGILDFEDAFLPQLLLADGQTMSEWARPQVDEVYRTGRMPRALPGLPDLPQLPEGKR